MKTLIYFNTIVNLIIVGYWIYKNNRLYISIQRTFWYKKIISVALMWKTDISETGYTATSLIRIIIRNPNDARELDSKQFHEANARKAVL